MSNSQTDCTRHNRDGCSVVPDTLFDIFYDTESFVKAITSSFKNNNSKYIKRVPEFIAGHTLYILKSTYMVRECIRQ